MKYFGVLTCRSIAANRPPLARFVRRSPAIASSEYLKEVNATMVAQCGSELKQLCPSYYLCEYEEESKSTNEGNQACDELGFVCNFMDSVSFREDLLVRERW